MELKEFIHKALTDFIQGVDEAQEELERTPHTIIPKKGLSEDASNYSSDVEFDIAVSVSREGSGSGGLKLEIPMTSISVGGELESKDVSATTSRIRFKVPVAFAFVDKQKISKTHTNEGPVMKQSTIQPPPKKKS